MSSFDPSAWLTAWLARADRAAIFGEDGVESYAALAEMSAHARDLISSAGIEPGAVVGLPFEYSIRAAGLLFALARHGSVVVLLSGRLAAASVAERCAIAGVDWLAAWGGEREVGFARERSGAKPHPLIAELRACGHPGLVLFTSGTTSAPKAVLHDLGRLLGRFPLAERPAVRVLPLMHADHIGGFDILWRGLAGGATITPPTDGSAQAVARLVEKAAVEVIAASPSQLGFLHAAGVLDPQRFASLRRIAHGAEAMPPALLARLQAALPHVRFEERFGTSETGAVVVRPRETGSPWFSIGDGTGWRVEAGELWLRSASRALGYLNAGDDGRFADDGWYRTGDMVDVVDGTWIRVIGRGSDVVNVGGFKVMPGEVEAVLMEMPEVIECAVGSEPHSLAGQVVVAEVVWRGAATETEILRMVRRHARARLAPAAVPVKVRRREAASTPILKKRRLADAAATNLP